MVVLDYKSAFLNAKQKTPIYCHPPAGIELLVDFISPKDCIVFDLNVYGTAKAPFDWYQLLTTSMVEKCDVKATELDPCLFITNTGVKIIVYMDDLYY
ncbi:hypothetical protein HK096_010133, partial [Nowakowskiella sp. JEL0078]